MKKKSKRSSRESREEERVPKRRRKERAQKTIHEQEGQKETEDVGDLSPRQVEEERPEKETELPATPSAGVGRGTPVPVVNIEEIEEPPNQAGPSSAPIVYQPLWEDIFEDS